MEDRLSSAIRELSAIFQELPVDWLHLDGDDSLPVQLAFDAIHSSLELPLRAPEVFWKLP